MIEQRTIVRYENELLIFFWGVIDDEIVGLLTYVSRPPRQLRQSNPPKLRET